MIVQGMTGQLSRSLEVFLGFEQRNLWKTDWFRVPGVESELEARYLPESCAAFRLPCFLVQRRHLYVYGGRDPRVMGFGAESGDAPEDWIGFPIHPAELARCAEFLAGAGALEGDDDGLRLWATPTSSTRTLLAWPDGQPERAFFAKLSLHSRLLGDRGLTRRRIASSVGLSHFVQQCRDDLPSGISYFPETLGLSPRGIEGSGVLFRSLPEEVRDGLVPAPLFALMGGSTENPPLFLEYARREGARAFEVLEEVLLAKFAALWVDLVFDFGLILEAHGQDLLLMLSPGLAPVGGFCYRDFEGLTVDWALRRARGLREPVLPHAFEWFPTYETWGYPLHQLAWHKIQISLFDYVHLVLAQLESAVRGWQENGLIAGGRVAEGDFTFGFSRYLRRRIEEKFGMKEAEEYDIHSHLTRFVKFLMLVRRAVMCSAASGDAGLVRRTLA